MTKLGAKLLPLLLACGCQTNEITWLERETLAFKAENERIRAEDLEKTYEKQKARSDALNADILALAEQREKLYAEYDRLKGEIERIKRERKQAKVDFDARAAELAQLRKQLGTLGAELEKERKLYDEQVRKLEETAAKSRALQAKNSGAKTPE
jgi:chromosome segregation ATPase